jgi:alpha-galactosidase
MYSMKKSIKVVLIGAGSAEFAGRKVGEMFIAPEMKGTNLTVSLVDIDAERLEIVYRFLVRLKKHFGSDARLEKTTDRCEALETADFVIISVEQKRYELWEQDYRIPWSYGFRQALGENAGPGGVFHALRSFHLLMPMFRDIGRICPQAIVFNFTNPESYVCLAAADLTNVKIYGLCHGMYKTRLRISTVLGRPLDELDIICGGLNHFHWVTKITERATGNDLYPEFRTSIENFPIACPPLVKEMLDIFGCYTYPSDDHIGEFIAFGWESLGGKWRYGREVVEADRALGHSVRGKITVDALRPYIDGTKPLDEFALDVRSEEHIIAIMAGLTNGTSHWEPAIITRNTGPYVDNLPSDAMVEVPAMIEEGRIRPLSIGTIPEPLAGFCRVQIAVQKATVQAYAHQSRALLLRALLLDPCITSINKARQMIDDMIKIQQKYLPEFK